LGGFFKNASGHPALDGETSIEEIRANIVRLEKQRDDELGGRLTELENELSVREKEHMKAQTALEAAKDNKKQEEKKRGQTQRGLNSVSYFIYFVLQRITFFDPEASFFKAKLAPAEFFVPTQQWCPAQLAPRRHVGANSRIDFFKKLHSSVVVLWYRLSLPPRLELWVLKSNPARVGIGW
jgi:hypothetical protein